jgi:hypothetical protein
MKWLEAIGRLRVSAMKWLEVTWRLRASAMKWFDYYLHNSFHICCSFIRNTLITLQYKMCRDDCHVRVRIAMLINTPGTKSTICLNLKCFCHYLSENKNLKIHFMLLRDETKKCMLNSENA